MSASGFIYAVEHGDDAVKIGFAKDPMQRLSELNVGASFELRLVGFVAGTMADEARTHDLCRGERIRGEWFHKRGAVIEFLRSLPPLAPKPPRIPSPLRRPVDLPLKWEIIDSIAVAMGVQREALKKWRRRGVPAAWQIKMVHEHPGLLSFDDFGTSVLIPLPGRPPPVHGPQHACDQRGGESSQRDRFKAHAVLGRLK